MTARETYVNPLLTNIYVGYRNTKLIAKDFFPTLTVDKETGIYFVRDKENLRSPGSAERGEFDRANRVTNGLAEATYSLSEKSLETPISDKVMRNYSDPFDPKSNATMLVSDKLDLLNEKDLKATILASSANNTDIAGAWATASTDIIGTVRSKADVIHKATGLRPNTFLISRDTLSNGILKNTAIIDAIKYTNVVTDEKLRQLLAQLFDVERVLIGDAVENTSGEGQADSMSWVWDDLAVLAFVNQAPVIEMPSSGYRLTQDGQAFVDEWYEQDIKTTFVRANDVYDNHVVDYACMEILSDTITT